MAEWGRASSPDGDVQATENVAWWKRRGVRMSAILLVVFLLGMGAGSGGDTSQAQDSENQIALLTSQLEEMDAELRSVRTGRGDRDDADAELGAREGEIRRLTEALSHTQQDLEDARAALSETQAALDSSDGTHLEARVEELSEALREAEDRAATAGELAERAAALDQRTEELAERAAELDRRDRDLAQREAAVPDPTPERAAGCAPGQVDINSASASALQRIHQVGPARAQQILALRPFRSVDDLTRVSGIGPAHLAAIKGQGLACVD